METRRTRTGKTGKAGVSGERKGMLVQPQWSSRSQSIDTPKRSHSTVRISSFRHQRLFRRINLTKGSVSTWLRAKQNKQLRLNRAHKPQNHLLQAGDWEGGWWAGFLHASTQAAACTQVNGGSFCCHRFPTDSCRATHTHTHARSSKPHFHSSTALKGRWPHTLSPTFLLHVCFN